jgi:hypothetical protein
MNRGSRTADLSGLAARPRERRRPVRFAAVNAAALPALPTLLARWLPDGRKEGQEYVALNPTRADRHLGSFRVNLRTGRWADFATTDDKGGDVVSLAAYLFRLRQAEAAERLAAALGVEAR